VNKAPKFQPSPNLVPDDESAPTGPSKSQLKRDATALQALGVRLVGLTTEKLDQLELPTRLHEEVLEAKRITAHEGRRRQMQLIGKIMRDAEEHDELRDLAVRIDHLERNRLLDTALLHRCEAWREKLLNGDEPDPVWFSEGMPEDAQARLIKVLKQTKAELAAGRKERYYRELFQQIRDLETKRQTLSHDE
jgi:ribosome-associated protein